MDLWIGLRSCEQVAVKCKTAEVGAPAGLGSHCVSCLKCVTYADDEGQAESWLCKYFTLFVRVA